MYDDLQVWFTIIKKYISETAFIESGRVYVKELGIVEVPLFDSELTMKLINLNPHLLENVHFDWRVNGDEHFTIERSFSIALYEQLMQEQAFYKSENAAAVQQSGQEAIRSIIGALQAMGFGVITEAFDLPPTEPEQTKPIPDTAQRELFRHALLDSAY